MNRIIFGMALAATAFNLGAAQPAPPIPPNWEPILTRPGALAKGSGHVQGFCVTSNAIYATLHDGLYKFDWYGHLLMHVSADKHQGDICYWNGKLYTAVCIPKDVPKRGRIDVWDENLKKIGTTEFVRPADGIACMDGVLYVGLGPARNPDKPFRGNYFGKFDVETLQPLCEPFLVDHGFDVTAGVQNIATDGERLYINFYTPEEDYPCFSCSTRTSRCSSRMCSGGGMASILWAAASRARCGSSTPSRSTAGRRRASRSSTRLRRRTSSDTLS